MAFTSANDINILQSSDAAVVGAGAGNDTYVLSPSTLSANQEITISDTQGSNKLQLIGGLTIASSTVASNAVLLTLSNGAKVTVLGADTFSYEVGGNPLTATTGTVQTYAQFATTTLGAASVPTTGTVSGTANVTIAGSTGGGAGQSFTLTTSIDVPPMTSGNDTVSGATSGLLGDGDVIADATATDNDSLTATVTVNNLKPTVAKVENITINGQFAATGLDLANTSGAKQVTLTTNIINGVGTIAGAKTGAAEKIVAGTNIGTLNVTADATTGTGGSLAIDAGSATTVALTAASTSDTVAVTINGDATVNHTSAVEALTVNATKASTVTLDSIGNALTVSGIGDVTVKITSAALDAETVAKSLTSGKLIVNTTDAAGGSRDYSKVVADQLKFSSTIGANTITVGTGAVVNLDVDAGNAASAFTAAAATATTNSITVNTKTDQTGLVFTNFKTVNLVSAATQVAGIDATYAVVNAGTNNVNLTGTNDVKVTAGTAKNFDASLLVGKLDYTQGAAADTTVKGGSGANVVSLAGTSHTSTYTGQNGGDTVTVATTTGTGTVTTGSGADAVTANGLTSGTVSLTLGDGANSVTSSGVITGALNVTTGSGTDTLTANAATTGTIAGSLGAGDDTVSVTGLTSGILSVDLGAGNDSVTLGTAITTATINVTGGDGTDTLKVANTTDVKGATLSLSGVENIQLAAAGSATFSAAQLNGKTFTLMGSGTSTDHYKVAEQTNAGATIDLSGLTLDVSLAASVAGVSITGGNGIDVITGTTGADTINGGTGADSIVFASTAVLNGVDVLTVVAGAGGDILNFKKFLPSGSVAQNAGTGTAIVAYKDTATGDVAIDNKLVLLDATTAATAAEVDTAAEVAALINGTGNVFSISAGGKSIVIAGDDSGALASAYIYFVHDMNGDGLVSGTNEVKLVGTIATFDVDTLITSNLVFA